MPSSACDWSSDVCSSDRSEEHTSELQSRSDLVCRLLLEKKKKRIVIPLVKEQISGRVPPSDRPIPRTTHHSNHGVVKPKFIGAASSNSPVTPTQPAHPVS